MAMFQILVRDPSDQGGNVPDPGEISRVETGYTPNPDLTKVSGSAALPTTLFSIHAVYTQ